MDNKPIIIDGVDVNECPCFSNWHTIITGDGIVYKEIENSCTPKQKPCEDIKDCCFKKLTKQLARKTDVCERLDYKIGSLEIDLNHKTQECEAKTLEFEGIKKQLDQLKAENEQLKEKIENYCFDCDVAEKMREVVYAATGGRLSYANYTVEAIEQAYNDQLLIDVEYRTEELEEQLKQAEDKLKQITDICKEPLYAGMNDEILQIIDGVER